METTKPAEPNEGETQPGEPPAEGDQGDGNTGDSGND